MNPWRLCYSTCVIERSAPQLPLASFKRASIAPESSRQPFALGNLATAEFSLLLSEELSFLEGFCGVDSGAVVMFLPSQECPVRHKRIR